jgi:carbon-monoxide dehydrogenase medium subunit
MLGRFTIHAPDTVQAACELLGQHGFEAAIYAGGTELLVVMKERLVEISQLIDIKRIPGLAEIRAENGMAVIGALATHRAIERHPFVRAHLPTLAELEANVANLRVRSAGTIGGNLCFAEPHSDPATLLTAWDARLVLNSSRGEREIAAADFFLGLFETARASDELMTAIRVPVPAAGTGSAYERFKIHERPTAAVAATVRLAAGQVSDVHIVAGSVADRPTRLPAAEAELLGQAPGDALFARAASAAHDEVEPSEERFESAAYKRQLVRVLTRRALTAAAARAGQEAA